MQKLRISNKQRCCSKETQGIGVEKWCHCHHAATVFLSSTLINNQDNKSIGSDDWHFSNRLYHFMSRIRLGHNFNPWHVVDHILRNWDIDLFQKDVTSGERALLNPIYFKYKYQMMMDTLDSVMQICEFYSVSSWNKKTKTSTGINQYPFYQ